MFLVGTWKEMKKIGNDFHDSVLPESEKNYGFFDDSQKIAQHHQNTSISNINPNQKELNKESFHQADETDALTNPHQLSIQKRSRNLKTRL